MESSYYNVSGKKENGIENKDWLIIPIWKIILDKGMYGKTTEVCFDNCNGSHIMKLLMDDIDVL